MRIILADHHVPTLRALKLMLQGIPEFELIGEAADTQDLLKLAQEQTADLVLVDWMLPGDSIEELIAMLHLLDPRPIVIVMGSQAEYGRRPLRAGADAYVSKGDQPQWLLDILYRYAQRITSENRSE